MYNLDTETTGKLLVFAPKVLTRSTFLSEKLLLKKIQALLLS